MIVWKNEGHRLVAMCGEVAIGAVFPAIGRRIRWRAWVTKNVNPVESTNRTIMGAKDEVEHRFHEFLQLAQLTPRLNSNQEHHQ